MRCIHCNTILTDDEATMRNAKQEFTDTCCECATLHYEDDESIGDIIEESGIIIYIDNDVY